MPVTALQETAEPPQFEDGDALIGGDEITAFVNQVLGSTYTKKTVYGWLLQGKVPFGKFGSRTFASKKAIRQTLARAAGIAA